MQKNIYVIAGPNGIGKTSSVFDLIPANIPIINSDEIAASIRLTGSSSINLQEYGNREALKLINGHMENGVSFAIETNLADVDTWKFLSAIRQHGYQVHLRYVSTDHIELLNTRIESRVLEGGHYVRPDIVEERYLNGLNLLSHYFKVPDTIELFDNSESLELVVKVSKGEILFIKKSLPGWVVEHFSKQLLAQEKPEMKNIAALDSIDEVRKAYEAMKRKAPNKKSKGKHL